MLIRPLGALHPLAGRPDFDHIVVLSKPERRPATVPKTGVGNPEALLATLAGVRGTVYFETGDLR